MSTNPRQRPTPAPAPIPNEELEAMLTGLRLPASATTWMRGWTVSRRSPARTNPAQIWVLVPCHSVVNGDTLLLLGAPAVGKSQLALARALDQAAVGPGQSMQDLGTLELISSSRPVMARGEGFATAIIHRLPHHSHALTIRVTASASEQSCEVG